MKIYICGDSTAASYPDSMAPLTGWGQVLGQFLDGVEIRNHAMAGRSSKSFLAEGRLQKVETEIEKGDLLLIQFAHNDSSDLVWRHSDPWTSFANHLSIFVDTARLYEAVPVLLTPICVRDFKDHVLRESHGDYLKAIHTVAQTRQVPLIDLYRKSFDLVQEVGEDASCGFYMHLEPGVWPEYKAGMTDNTHTQTRGAEAYARLVAESLRELKLI